MVEATLPGHGGLDLVLQRYYSSNIWNRVEGGVYTKAAASSDPMDHLGGSGWQLHMGKVIQPLLTTDPWMAVMPDGSTHLLYNNANGPGRISRERWTFVWNSSTSSYDLTLSDGTVYSFSSNSTYADYYNRQVYQCTKISKPGVSSSIQITYATILNINNMLSTITDTYGRTVQFNYVSNSYYEPPRITTMTVKSGWQTLQTWAFSYSSSPQATFAEYNGQPRDVYALSSAQPPEGNAWGYTYWPGTTSYGNGKYCLKQVTLPTGGTINYTYMPVAFNTGTQSCNVQFCVVASRQAKDRGGSVIGNWSYAYSTPGSDGATTTVTVKDAQNSTLLTDVSVFNGWGPYIYGDRNMWKVGLLQQRTVTTFGVSPHQTEVETYTWTQGDTLSYDFDRTTNWLACGSYRQWQGIYFAKPDTVTRTVTRDNVAYTTTRSNFDAYGNPGTLTEKVSTSQKRTTQLAYWTNTSLNILLGKVKTEAVSPGAQQCAAYDSYGRRTKKVLSPSSTSPCMGNSSSLETDYTYASSGDLTQETKKANGVGQDSVTQYLSYSYGQPKQIKVANTNIWFDRTVNPTGTIATSTDGRGSSYIYRTRYSYDDLNRLTEIQPPVSGSLPTTFTYASDWSTVTVTRGGHSIEYSFDGLGRLIGKHDLQTDHRVTYTYNALGVKTQEKFLYGSTTVDTTAYDALGRPTSVTHAGDSSSITYTYSATSGTGPSATVTDEDAKQTTLAYEGFGDPDDTRLVSVIDALGHGTTYQYNSYNLVSGITAPLTKGNRSFTYYANLLLHTETSHESGATTYAYDGLGNLTQKTRANGTWEDFNYDRANRLIEHSFSDSTPTVSFTYDGASQRTQVSNSDVTFDYVYDGNKNLTSKQTSAAIGSKTEALSYDDMDRLDTVTYPSGREVTYTYDDRDWVTDVTEGSTSGGADYATGITRYVTGAIQQLSLGNGATTGYGLDDRYRVNAISTSAAAGSVMSLGFTYDPAGDLTDWDDNLDSSNSRTFGYDDLHRLTSANASGLWGNLTLGYDALGNRTSRAQTYNGTVTSSYTYDTNNRLTQVKTGSLTEQYSYDARGSLATAVIPQPTITSVSPVQVQPGGGGTTVAVTISGSGFLPSSQSTFNGVAKPPTFVSASTLEMTLTYDDITSANIYPVGVINPNKPGKATPQAAGATAPMVVYFADVPPSHAQYDSVNKIRYNGITAGCTGSQYCPDDDLWRSQMAVYLLKAKHGSGYTPPACSGIFGVYPVQRVLR